MHYSIDSYEILWATLIFIEIRKVVGLGTQDYDVRSTEQLYYCIVSITRISVIGIPFKRQDQSILTVIAVNRRQTCILL